MKKYFLKISMCICGLFAMLMIFSSPLSAQNLIWAPDALNRIIDEGMRNNQSIKSMESQVVVLNEQTPAAGSLPDPRIGIGVLNLPVDTFDFDQEPMTQKQIFVAQKFPWFGKLSLMSEDAEFSARLKQTQLDMEKRALARKIAEAYYELGYVAKSQEVTDRLRELVGRISRAAETRYATGRGLQQNIFQAQVELTRLDNEKIMLNKQRRVVEDRLNELLNRNEYLPVEPPSGLPGPDFQLSLSELKETARNSNPGLKIKELDIGQSKIKIELAKKDYWPDVDVMVAYGQRDENKAGRDFPDFFSTSVVMNIPLWQNTRQDRKLAAMTASGLSAEHAYQYLADSLNHQIDALAAEILNSQESYQLHVTSLIPQAGQWARSALDTYEVGEVEFDTMINAQMRVMQFELQAQRLLFSIYQKRSQLEEIIGQPIADNSSTISNAADGTN